MNDEEIEILQREVRYGHVYWMMDETAIRVRYIGEHQEEGPGELCAILDAGRYAALSNAQLSDFYQLKTITR